MLTKILVLGGWFYITLVAAVCLFWLGKKKFRQFLVKAVIVWAAIAAVYLSIGAFLKLGFDAKHFFRPIEQKQDEQTVGQYAYALHLKNILPTGASGCILWAWDLPTYYLQKELYPRKFSIATMASGNCEYFISQFAPVENESFELVDKYENGYLYKLRH